MDKLQMAHEYAMEMARQGIPLKSCLQLGWKYADAMQAEWDSRINKDRPCVLHDEFQPTGYETPTDEWKPDWSQAPEWAKWWAVDGDNNANWYKRKPSIDDTEFYSWKYSEAPSFNYQGDWKNSLRSRP